MKLRSLILFFTALLFSLFLSNCNNPSLERNQLELKQKELELKERELSLKKQEDSISELNKEKSMKEVNSPSEVSSNTKYLFIIIKTNEPRIESKEIPPEDIPQKMEAADITTGLMPTTTTPHFLPEKKYLKYAISQTFNYTSDIVEISQYDEDKEYKEIDKFENEVLIKLSQSNRHLQLENMYKPGDYVDAEAKIVSKQAYVYDSYKTASIIRDEMKN